MSVRFFKILAGVFLAHIIVFNVVWMGFSAPFPRPPVTFTYQGSLPADEDTSGGAVDEWQNGRTSAQMTWDRVDAPDLNHWAKLREPSK